MSTKYRPFVIAAVCVAALVGMRMLAVAGPLDPPAGPVQPTMHTLEEIYQRLGEPCCVPTWSYVKADAPTDSYLRVIQGSGILHAVITGFGGNMPMSVRDGTGSEILACRANIQGQVQLDVRYQQGVEIRALDSGPVIWVTLLFRPDPS